jgi:phosphatidate cytidylyltransferase
MIRLLSAALLIALVVAVVWLLPPWATVALAALAAALAGGEVAGLAARIGTRASPAFLGTAAALVAVAFAVDEGFGPLTSGPDALVLVLLALVVSAGALALASGPPDATALNRAATAFMVPVYVGLPLGALAAVRLVAGPPGVLLLIAIVALSDTAQFYVGRLIGRRKLAPLISPAKTVEGAAGGVVAAAVAGGLLLPRGLTIPVPVAPATGVLLGIGIAGFGIAGDLFESLLKRSAGVKDSSSLIPGHGGVLDRLDSYLFAAPLFYAFLRIAA